MMNFVVPPPIFEAIGGQILRKHPSAAFVVQQVWSHLPCLLCSLGSFGRGTSGDAQQSPT